MARPQLATSFFFSLLFLVLVAESHAVLSSPQEEYWHSELPSTPMPSIVMEILDNKGTQKRLENSIFLYGKDPKKNPVIAEKILEDPEENPTVTKKPLEGSISYDPSVTAYSIPFFTYGKGGDTSGYDPSVTAYTLPIFTYGKGGGDTSGYDQSVTAYTLPIFTYGKGGGDTSGYDPSVTAYTLPFFIYGKGGHTETSGHTDTSGGYDPSITVVFQEKDLKPDAKMKLAFTRTGRKDAAFLSRRDAESIPFSSSMLPEILSLLSVNPKSAMAVQMKKALEMCELPAAVGERKLCSTSLESMIDFTVSSLGTKQVEVIATVITKDENNLQWYTVAPNNGIRMLPGEKHVACHELAYPYATFLCHAAKSRAYVVDFVGEDGTRAEAVAVCHTDTKRWDPSHLAFKVLKVKPGTVPICHFVPQDTLIWSQKQQSESTASV